MRTLFSILSLCTLALFVSACTDTTSPTNTTLGKTTLDEIKSNTAYAWFEPGYQSFPGTDAKSKARFDSSVAKIKSSFDPTKHTVIMALKLSCGCTDTQITLPEVIKTLDSAGVPHSNLSMFATDARLNGIDSIKALYSINSAPIYIVLKNGVVKGQIIKEPLPGMTIDQELAKYFEAP